MTQKRWLIGLLAVIVISSPLAGEAVPQDRTDSKNKVIRVGIIGLDTSHVVAFTNLLNNPKNTGDLAGFKVVAAYPGGSKDIKASYTRLERFTNTLREKHNVKIVDSIEKLVDMVDVVLLESVDGRPHLKQIIPVLKAGKLVFIDKPIAGSLADAIEIFRLSKKHKTPVFSSSSLRFTPGVANLRDNDKIGKVMGAMTWSPCSLEPTHPDLFWYGVHGVEALFAIMGTGCEKVTRVHTPGADVVTGVWKDGRIGTFRGIRSGKSGYGAMVFGSKAIVVDGKYSGYKELVTEICKFFRTGEPPVSAEETIEMFAFMEAADESKRRGGEPVSIAEVIQKASR